MEALSTPPPAQVRHRECALRGMAPCLLEHPFSRHDPRCPFRLDASNPLRAEMAQLSLVSVAFMGHGTALLLGGLEYSHPHDPYLHRGLPRPRLTNLVWTLYLLSPPPSGLWPTRPRADQKVPPLLADGLHWSYVLWHLPLAPSSHRPDHESWKLLAFQHPLLAPLSWHGSHLNGRGLRELLHP